jgi:hypothetical protein
MWGKHAALQGGFPVVAAGGCDGIGHLDGGRRLSCRAFGGVNTGRSALDGTWLRAGEWKRPRSTEEAEVKDTLTSGDETPTVEVRVFQYGRLVHQELCESDEQAALVVEEWSELEGVECEVDDLSSRHGPGDVLASEPAELAGEEDYSSSREEETQRYERKGR